MSGREVNAITKTFNTIGLSTDATRKRKSVIRYSPEKKTIESKKPRNNNMIKIEEGVLHILDSSEDEIKSGDKSVSRYFFFHFLETDLFIIFIFL